MRVLFLLAMLPLAGISQKRSNTEIYSRTITGTDLQKHLYVVAGPQMEGRETATEGERRAASYIVDHFKQLGLSPAHNGDYLMPFPLYRDSVVDISFSVNGKQYEPGKDYMITGGPTKLEVNASSLLYIGVLNPDSANKSNFFGRIVISQDYGSLYSAFSKGAIAGILIQPEYKSQSSQRTGYLMREKYQSQTAPAVAVVGEPVGREIIGGSYDSLMQAGKQKQFKPHTVSANISLAIIRQTREIFSNNILGIIEGTDKKDEYLFITAHYDHEGKRANGAIYYGADDDGSGTVAILELAEAFAKAKAAGKGPRRTIVFMPVSGEEKGLWGSDYYSSHPVFPLEKTTADLNIDMIGRIDPDYKGDSLNYVYAIGENKLSSDLQKITDAINKKCCRLTIDRKFNDPKDPNRFYYRSDHYNFAKKGVPIIFYFNGVHKDYHQPTDTPDKINYTLLEKRARLIFHTAWEIANRDEMLKRDMPLN